MIRKAFVMSVHPGMETEYQRRHNPVWQELLDTLKKHGAHEFPPFLAYWRIGHRIPAAFIFNFHITK